MNTLPPASVPSATSSAQALSNSSSTSSPNASENASANPASSDSSASGSFHQVLNQQIAQNNSSASDAKSASARPATAAASSTSAKSTKSTHSSTTTASAGATPASASGAVTAQQAAAISAAAAQAAQAANPDDTTQSATATALGGALLSSQLAGAELGNSSGTASASASADALGAADSGQEAPAADQAGATPGSVWGAMDESGQQHMLTGMAGKGDADDTDLSDGSGGAAPGASLSAPSATSNTASAFLMTQRVAMNSEQSLFSSAADKPHDSSGIPTAGSSDASLAAAQASTTQVATPSGSAGSTVTSASVPYQMGSDAWRADVSSHVLYFSQQDISSAELHLNPAHLSPLNISISVDNNQTSIAFNAAHEATRQAMQDSLPQLREMFQAHGIALGQTTVGDSSAGSAQQQNSNNTRSGSGNASLASKALESSSTAVNGPSGVRIRSLQIVDTFA
jgi:flagellar hook-length control protein FliK